MAEQVKTVKTESMKKEGVNKAPAESKAERFRRLATARVTKALKMIGFVGNLGDRRNYEYTEAQSKAVIGALKRAVELCEQAYSTGGKREEVFVL